MLSEKKKDLDHVHFIGIGGIGMSALAKILLEQGKKVQGSDLSFNQQTEDLKNQGAEIFFGHHKEFVGGASCVVYSSAIQPSNPEFSRALSQKCKLFHRSELLDHLMKGTKPLLVTGMHGKTTATSLLAHILMEAKFDPSFVIGGIPLAYKTNGRHGKGEYFVAEADESDGSFLQTPGFGAIVTNIDKEHLDYWKSEEKIYEGFFQFFSQVKNKDLLFWCLDDPVLRKMQPSGTSYGFSEEAKLRVSRVEQEGFSSKFSIQFEGKFYENIELGLIGKYNALNAAAVFGMGLVLGIEENVLRKALKNFSGVARRMENFSEHRGVKFFDDYGHHPKEIQSTIKALKEAIGEKKLLVFFQPHRFSRTRDLYQEFGSAFDGADEAFITDIYSASESPIEGITSSLIVEEIKKRKSVKVHELPKEQFLSASKKISPLDVVLIIGAGDITHLGRKLAEEWKKEDKKYTVGVLFGGKSPEHEVSIVSAKNIASQLKRDLYDVKIFGLTKKGKWLFGDESFSLLEKNYEKEDEEILPQKILQELLTCDICIPVFHGPCGEDGMFPAFLEAFDIPYVGCDYASSSLCMQKAWAKKIAMQHGVQVTPFVEVSSYEWQKERKTCIEKIEKTLTYPIFVKPVRLGSSIGIRKVTSREVLEEAINHALLFDVDLILEEGVVGQEVEFAVLGTDVVKVGIGGEVLTGGDFYDYDKKYGSHGMKTKIPANISEEAMEEGKKLAEKVYRLCGCSGLCRVDFFYNTKKEFLFNEANTFPGFTAISLYPQMMEAAGIKQTDLMDELIVSGFYYARRKKRLVFSR
jgi:UDP-N-acetylmuramate--alanine ligase